jgi:hypothetical protein
MLGLRHVEPVPVARRPGAWRADVVKRMLARNEAAGR